MLRTARVRNAPIIASGLKELNKWRTAISEVSRIAIATNAGARASVTGILNRIPVNRIPSSNTPSVTTTTPGSVANRWSVTSMAVPNTAAEVDISVSIARIKVHSSTAAPVKAATIRILVAGTWAHGRIRAVKANVSAKAIKDAGLTVAEAVITAIAPVAGRVVRMSNGAIAVRMADTTAVPTMAVSAPAPATTAVTRIRIQTTIRIQTIGVPGATRRVSRVTKAKHRTTGTEVPACQRLCQWSLDATGLVFNQARNTSATLHAWATHPPGANGASASKISLMLPTPASQR